MSLFNCVEAFYASHPGKRIGDISRSEVIPYLRNLSVLPDHLKSESIHRANHENVEAFLLHLKNAWCLHNELALEIDGFLMKSVDWKTFSCKDAYLLQALEYLPRAYQTEDEKRIYSAGVKESLDKAEREAVARYRLTREEVATVFTLWEPSYWLQHDGVHATWLLNNVRKHLLPSNIRDTVVTTEYVCKQFHSDSHNVLRERLSEGRLEKLALQTDSELGESVYRWRTFEERVKDRRIEALYLMMGRDDLKKAQALVRYDNLTEVFFGVNFWGIPDLFLRKTFVNTLIRKGVIDQRSSILMYPLSDLCNAAGLRSNQPIAINQRRL